MGMYTEFFINVQLKEDTPDEIIGIVRLMIEGGDRPADTPAHPFFECDRWRVLLRMSSFYFVPFPTSHFEKVLGSYFLTSRSDLKNYDDEIDKFVDWLAPWFDCDPGGQFIGYKRYEEADNPTLLYADPEGRVVWHEITGPGIPLGRKA